MILIKKFYDAAVAESGAATEEAPVVSLAAQMAKAGQKTENSPVTFVPQQSENKTENTEVKEKPISEEKKIAETANSVQKEKDNIETPKPKDEVKEVQQEQKVSEQPKQQTLEEVLKQVQPNVVLKALGYDDKAIGILDKLNGFEKSEYFDNLLNVWKTNGDLNSYVKELSTDYTKMPDEDVMRHQLQKEYPKANPKQLDVLFKKEVIEKYNLDSDDENERTEGQLLLGTKADKFRDELIENQKQFLTPKPPEPKVEQPDNTAETQRQEFEVYKTSVTDNSLTKELFNNKRLSVGEGDEKINISIDNPQDITELLFDGDKWAKSFFTVEKDANGNEKLIPDIEKQLFVAAATKDLKGLLKQLATHYKALGGKAVIDPIDNAKPKDGDNSSKAQAQPQTMAEAMAKGGKIKG